MYPSNDSNVLKSKVCSPVASIVPNNGIEFQIAVFVSTSF